MPSSPKRPCSYPGCPKLTDGQYCEDHAAVARRQYNKYERAPDINKKYGRAWKRIRDRHISLHPLCEQCEKDGKIVPAVEVHHKIPSPKAALMQGTTLCPCADPVTTKSTTRLATGRGL